MYDDLLYKLKSAHYFQTKPNQTKPNQAKNKIKTKPSHNNETEYNIPRDQ